MAKIVHNEVTLAALKEICRRLERIAALNGICSADPFRIMGCDPKRPAVEPEERCAKRCISALRDQQKEDAEHIRKLAMKYRIALEDEEEALCQEAVKPHG